MNFLHAIILGAVEGLTEFLPISSTGHLILTARKLHLHGEVIKTFTIVIQAGALGAVLGLYHREARSIWRGLLGRDERGGRLLLNLMASFLPVGVAGLLFHRLIKERLFGAWPVVWALAVGGLFMIGMDIWLRSSRRKAVRTLDSLRLREALLIGFAQCLSLWPGTSRAMVTIAAGMLLGFPATVAAEYSFLVALPTLGVATLFDAAIGGPALLRQTGLFPIAAGFFTAAVVAAVAIRGLLRYFTHRGLAPFGWYRIGLALAVWWASA